jgi:hypothetical protein
VEEEREKGRRRKEYLKRQQKLEIAAILLPSNSLISENENSFNLARTKA